MRLCMYCFSTTIGALFCFFGLLVRPAVIILGSSKDIIFLDQPRCGEWYLNLALLLSLYSIDDNSAALFSKILRLGARALCFD